MTIRAPAQVLVQERNDPQRDGQRPRPGTLRHTMTLAENDIPHPRARKLELQVPEETINVMALQNAMCVWCCARCVCYEIYSTNTC